MTDAEKLETVRVLTKGETDNDADAVLSTYLLIASKKILARLYPYDDTQTDIPAKYETLQCEIAAYLLNKRGADGELQHTENGISRQFASADVPNNMLSEIIPHVGVLS